MNFTSLCSQFLGVNFQILRISQSDLEPPQSSVYAFLHLVAFSLCPWRRKWQPTPLFLPGESQGWGSLVGCRLRGRTVGHDSSDSSSSSSRWLTSKNLPVNAGDTGSISDSGWGRFLVEGSGNLPFSWEIPWTEEPGELQSMGLQRVRHDLPNKHTHTHTHTQRQQISPTKIII